MSIVNVARLYQEKIVPEWRSEEKLSSPLAVPRLVKISLNMGLKDAVTDRKVIDQVLEDFGRLAGQRPIATRARKSIAGFKIREGMIVGARVTLRRERMFNFLDRLINIALPRVRDFRGLAAKSFDGRGNYSFGITEHIVFPEVEYEKIDKMRGLDITIATTAATDAAARKLLVAVGLPIRSPSGD
ncbi:MAG: 50S ribosomal protein L5 [Betaproteobacteria bacterium]|nr:50S ribosomal protein L5 [Betaproteobacteria bacterium]